MKFRKSITYSKNSALIYFLEMIAERKLMISSDSDQDNYPHHKSNTYMLFSDLVCHSYTNFDNLQDFSHYVETQQNLLHSLYLFQNMNLKIKMDVGKFCSRVRLRSNSSQKLGFKLHTASP